MSFILNFDPITENSYCNRSNLSVIGKKIHKDDMKIDHLTFFFMSFSHNRCKEFYKTWLNRKLKMLKPCMFYKIILLS